MPVQEILRREWPDFIETFSRQHRGILVTVESVHRGEPPLTVTQALPLQAVELEPGSSRDQGTVHVRAGRSPDDDALDIRIQASRLLFEISEAGEHVGLIFEGAHGAQSRLRFRVPFLPEALDGLLVSEE